MLGIAGLTGVIMVAQCFREESFFAPPDRNENYCGANSPALVLGGLAFVGVWGWSIHDAGAAARRANVRAAGVARLTQVPLTLGVTRRPTASGHDARALKVGMRFSVR
jgi:hypothetical protein